MTRKPGTYVTKCGIRKKYPDRENFEVPNWKKVAGRQDAWEHIKTYTGVSVEVLGDYFYVEERYITEDGTEQRNVIEGNLPNRKSALKVAKIYMQNNSDF